MNMQELQGAVNETSIQLKRRLQANKRLKEHLEGRSPTVTLKNVPEACDVLKEVFSFISSKREDATQVILNAIIDFEVGDGLLKDLKEDRKRYADFIVSDIHNACKKFTGATNEIRFHPIMANLAANLYIGMKYEDMKDISPFIFPTVRSVQRNRSKVETKEGGDPKIYARVSEMKGFSTEMERRVDWLFDEVKLTSGLMWNAKNDNFRGLCCGTTGSAAELKDLLHDFLSTEDNVEEKTSLKLLNNLADDDDDDETPGIYCNQWLARNAFGSTLMGEFFYNEAGSLDGNEVMRQYLKVSTGAAIAGLTTIGL
jgi:hypothetical protein